MFIRKTIETKKKLIFRGKYEKEKETALYRVTTYWFIFIPIYRYEEVIE